MVDSTLAQFKGCLSLNLFGYVCLFQNVTLILSKKEQTHVEVLDGDAELCWERWGEERNAFEFFKLTFCWTFTWSDSFADCFWLKSWDCVLSLYRESKWMVWCWTGSQRIYFVWLNHCKMIGRHGFKSSTSCAILCNLLKVFEVLLVFFRFFCLKPFIQS